MRAAVHSRSVCLVEVCVCVTHRFSGDIDFFFFIPIPYFKRCLSETMFRFYKRGNYMNKPPIN